MRNFRLNRRSFLSRGEISILEEEKYNIEVDKYK